LSGRGIEDKVFMPGIEPASSSHAFWMPEKACFQPQVFWTVYEISLFISHGSAQPFEFFFGFLFQRSAKVGLGVGLEEATLFPKGVFRSCSG
jgi:hypothetical protein